MVRCIANSLEGRLLLSCVLAIQHATGASAQRCSGVSDVARSGGVYVDDDSCYSEVCAALGCSFGCINDDHNGGFVCEDSHQFEYSATEWNSNAMDAACRCARGSESGGATCERIPCAVPFGDDTCISANNGWCDEVSADGACPDFTDCTDCGNCGYNDCHEDCEATIATGVLVLLLVSVFTCVGVGASICCIIQKSKTLGSRPHFCAWMGSFLICIFGWPLCMWIPFVSDCSYESTDRTSNGGISQQTQQQPVIAQAQPTMAEAQGQPVAAALAQPITAHAQAQPMVSVVAQPVGKLAQGP